MRITSASICKCRIQLFPCSYKKHHKKRPYFKTAQGIEHTTICGFNKYTTQLRKARNGDISKNGIIPYPYPSKLIKPLKQTFKVDNNLPAGSIESEKYKPGKATRANNLPNLVQGNRVVTSIGQIVDFYLNSPFNRHASLQLLDKQTEYRFAFKRVKGNGEYNGLRIYFGRVNLSKQGIVESDSSLEIKLFEFDEWVKSGVQNYYYVLIDKLSSRNKSRILTQLDIVKNEKLENYEENKRNAYLFFLGNPPDKKAPYQFKAIESHVVCRYNEILPTQIPKAR